MTKASPFQNQSRHLHPELPGDSREPPLRRVRALAAVEGLQIVNGKVLQGPTGGPREPGAVAEGMT
jgi:hypothetical protein